MNLERLESVKESHELVVPVNDYLLTNKEKVKLTKQQIFEKSYIELLNILDDKITTFNLINIITRSMEIVEQYKQLSGMEKKMMVIKIITALIEKHEQDEEIKRNLIDLVNTIGVSAIDTIVYAANGKLDVLNMKLWKKIIKRFKCPCFRL